jgi:hypothetical protein
MNWLSGPMALEQIKPAPVKVNTRTSLWPERWPAIAKQSCIDEVEAAQPELQSATKYNLPCATCELAAACLNAKHKELGTLLYDREILTRPRSSESSLFPRELMEPMLDPNATLVQAWTKPGDRKGEFQVAQAWDLAWSERIGGDYLVCMTAAVDQVTGQTQLLQLERWQRLSFDEQCLLIEAKWRQYAADVVVIESDAAQAIWAQHMAATTPVPVLKHDAGGKTDQQHGVRGGKKNLEHGVPGMLIAFQNRKWTFPHRRGSWCFEEVENLLTELEAFGWSEGKLQGVGEHDDTVMAMWHLWWAVNTVLLRPWPLRSHMGVQKGRTA